MDQMSRTLAAKYLLSNIKKKPKVNIIPVPIDFPLPNAVQGIDSRMNDKCSFELPPNYLQKNHPHQLVGSVTRLQHLLSHHQEFVGKTVTVAGWAFTAKLQSKDTLLFIGLVDGSNCIPLQVVIENKVGNWEQLKKAKRGYTFRIRGTVEKSIGKGQTIELKLKGQPNEMIKIVGKCDDEKYPLTGDKVNLETLRDIAHLRPRTQVIGAVTRVKNNLSFATHQFFQNNGYLYIHTPIITASDCEGAGDMFQVTTILPKSGEVKEIPQVGGKIDYSAEFFKKVANLTVSGQLAVENYCCSLGNVYTFGPTFRAEVSHTSRHMAQFWMIEPQIAFADVYDVMQCAQAYVQFCIKFILENNKEDIAFLDKRKNGHSDYLKKLVEGPFAKISYTQAIEILKKVIQKGVVFENPVYWGVDLASEHQRYLCDHVFHKPVILYNYPRDIKSFYMRANDDGKTVASFDILAPQVGEIVGGSQRQERLEVLEKRMDELKLPKQNYWWYLDLRKHGTVPHGGFGLGFERLVMMCTGIDNIRDVACFPRTVGNAQF